MATPAALPNLSALQVTEKLTRENYLLWKAQVLPAIRGARLIGYLDGSITALEEKLQGKEKDSSSSAEIQRMLTGLRWTNTSCRT
jgi:hypothetical protein